MRREGCVVTVAIRPGLPERLRSGLNVLSSRSSRHSSRCRSNSLAGGAIGGEKWRNSVILAGHWPPTGRTQHYTMVHSKDRSHWGSTLKGSTRRSARNSSDSTRVYGTTHGVLLLLRVEIT